MTLPDSIPDLPDKLAQRKDWEAENERRGREGAKEFMSWTQYTPLVIALPFINWVIENMPLRSADGRPEEAFHKYFSPKQEFFSSNPEQFEIMDDGNLWYFTRRGERFFDIMFNFTDILTGTTGDPWPGRLFQAQPPEFQAKLPWRVKLWEDTELPANVPLVLPAYLALLAIKKYKLPIIQAPTMANGQGLAWSDLGRQWSTLPARDKKTLVDAVSTVAYISPALRSNSVVTPGQPPPGPMMSDARALEIVREAWKTVRGSDAKKGEAIIVCAIGRFEGKYGAAFGGINNWGAIQTRNADEGVLISEYNPNLPNPDIKVYVRKYATPLDGAIGLIKELTRRKGVPEALAVGSSEKTARAMYNTGYYTTRSKDPETAIAQYTSAINSSVSKIEANTGEKLYVPNKPGPAALGLLLLIPVFTIPIILAKRAR